MADAGKPVEPAAPAAGDVQKPVIATELDGAPHGTAAEAAPVADPAVPITDGTNPAETETSKADKRKSRSGDLLKKLQFWKKDKKDAADAQ